MAFYHFLHSLIEDNVSHFYANIFRQMKIFLRARERVKIAQQSKKQLKFENIASRLS
jgi:hypothetical protein